MVRGAVNLGRKAWRAALWAEALGALLLGAVLVHGMPLRFTLRLFGTVRQSAGPAAPPVVPPPAFARAQAAGLRLRRVADRLPWTSTCLVRAVALGLLLKRRGIAGWSIRFGVAKTGGALAAHAWMVMGAEILIGGAQAPGFVPLADLNGHDQASTGRDG